MSRFVDCRGVRHNGLVIMEYIKCGEASLGDRKQEYFISVSICIESFPTARSTTTRSIPKLGTACDIGRICLRHLSSLHPTEGEKVRGQTGRRGAILRCTTRRRWRRAVSVVSRNGYRQVPAVSCSVIAPCHLLTPPETAETNRDRCPWQGATRTGQRKQTLCASDKEGKFPIKTELQHFGSYTSD